MNRDLAELEEGEGVVPVLLEHHPVQHITQQLARHLEGEYVLERQAPLIPAETVG